MAFLPYDPSVETHVHRQRLPHWRQWGTTYFVTTRLADSIPNHLADEWRRKRDEWLLAHHVTDPAILTEEDRDEYHREFNAKFHDLLDAGHGECILANPNCAERLIQRLLAGHGTAYQLDVWCIMPNHIHALVEPAENVPLGEIIRHWKGGSSHDINQLLQRRGSLWQREPFDHIVRSEAQLEHFRRYIENNPQKAGLKTGFVVGHGCESKSTHGL